MTYQITLVGPDGWVKFRKDTAAATDALVSDLIQHTSPEHEIQIEPVRGGDD